MYLGIFIGKVQSKIRFWKTHCVKRRYAVIVVGKVNSIEGRFVSSGEVRCIGQIFDSL